MGEQVELGFFRRAGTATDGLIGSLRGSWDRHRGGVLRLGKRARGRSSGGAGVRVAARARVTRAGRPVLLRQELDPDPRLIVAEQGPERIWMRAMFSLLDDAGTYHGDGLTDTILYADGEVRLALSIRLVDAAAHDSVTDAWVEMDIGEAASGLVGTARARKLDLSRTANFPFRRGLPGRYVALDGRGGGLAVGWHGPDGRAEDKLGGVGLWHGPGDRAPWYDTWGHLYDQWRGLSGWGGHRTGRLVIEPGERQGSARLNWHWLRGADEPTGANFGCRGLLGLYFDRDGDASLARLRASFAPPVPTVRGAQFRCLDVVENTLLFRRTGPGPVELTFPPDNRQRTIRVRVFGLDSRGGVAAAVGGRRVVAHLLSLGGMTDDPYGPNLARPGDRFVPLVGDEQARSAEAVLSFRLAARRKTSVLVNDSAPVGLAYLKWDDRQVYLVRSRRLAEHWPTALFSVQTLSLHDVRRGQVPSDLWLGRGPSGLVAPPPPAVVRLPLYWYPTNVQTRGQCVNELESLLIACVGDGQTAGLVLAVRSVNPNRRLVSLVTAELPGDRPQVRVSARLDILARHGLDEIQFLNCFPYDSWQPADWETGWVVTMDDAGRQATYLVTEPRGRWVVGDPATQFERAFFVAVGPRDRGNIFILARAPGRVRQRHRYALCRVWLDSHLSVDGLGVRAGRRGKLAMNYTVAVWGDSRLTAGQAGDIARRSIRTGRLEFREIGPLAVDPEEGDD